MSHMQAVHNGHKVLVNQDILVVTSFGRPVMSFDTVDKATNWLAARAEKYGAASLRLTIVKKTTYWEEV